MAGSSRTYNILDLTPKGRNEKSNLTDWVRLHDRYEETGLPNSTDRYHAGRRKIAFTPGQPGLRPALF